MLILMCCPFLPRWGGAQMYQPLANIGLHYPLVERSPDCTSSWKYHNYCRMEGFSTSYECGPSPYDGIRMSGVAHAINYPIVNLEISITLCTLNNTYQVPTGIAVVGTLVGLDDTTSLEHVYLRNLHDALVSSGGTRGHCLYI